MTSTTWPISHSILPLILSIAFQAIELRAQGGPCLSYEPNVVKLVGVLKEETFPGPPNYDNIKNGDEPEMHWILHLERPVCVIEDSSSELNNETERNIKRVQLVFGKRRVSEFAIIAKAKILVIGTLFHAHTAHHHTKVLLTVQGITRLR